MVLQQIHILEEMSLASLSQKEQFLVGLLFFSPIDILAWNIKILWQPGVFPQDFYMEFYIEVC